MALQLRKKLTGSWDQVRYGLKQDLDSIEAAINTKFAKLFPGGSTISPSALPVIPASGGGTGQTTYNKGDLLVGNAVKTLDKLGVGSDGQILTADSTQTDGVKWAAAAGSSIPIATLVNFTIPTNQSAVGSESLEITAGTTLEISSGALLEITGDVTQDLGSISMGLEAGPLGGINLTNVGDIDFFVGGTTSFVPQASASYHSKLKGGQLAPGYAWLAPSGITISTTTGNVTLTTTAGDDINTALSATGSYLTASGTINVGWRFRVVATPKRQYLRIGMGIANGTATITAQIPGSKFPAQTLLYTGGGTNRFDMLKLSFTGAFGSELLLTMQMTSNPSGTPLVAMGWAALSTK